MTVVLSARLGVEPVGTGLVLGGLLIVAGVYIGALRGGRQPKEEAMDVIERLTGAINGHDADGMASCFADDYRSVHPTHPARGFGGRDQVAENWSTYFDEIPDIRMDVLARADAGATAWIEVRIHGTRRDGSAFDLRGVIVNEIAGDRIATARFYVEPVEEGGQDIIETVQRWATGAQ